MKIKMMIIYIVMIARPGFGQWIENGNTIYTNDQGGTGTTSPQADLALIGDEIVFGAAASKISKAPEERTVQAHSSSSV